VESLPDDTRAHRTRPSTFSIATTCWSASKTVPRSPARQRASDWMDNADGWMGRRSWGLFQTTQMFAGPVHARVLLKTTYAPPFYGHARAQDFRALVERGVVDADEYARFIADLEALEKQGRYFL
jgi:hypothetical protein